MQLPPVVPTATPSTIEPNTEDSLSVRPNLIKTLYYKFVKDSVPSVHLSPQVLIKAPQPPQPSNQIVSSVQTQDLSLSNRSDDLWQKADDTKEPYQNIKNALVAFEVGSAENFRTILPRLRQTVQEAAQAVGYYDVSFSLAHAGGNRVQVKIDSLGEPVRVARDVFELRGEGAVLSEFQALQQKPPNKDKYFTKATMIPWSIRCRHLDETKGF